MRPAKPMRQPPPTGIWTVQLARDESEALFQYAAAGDLSMGDALRSVVAAGLRALTGRGTSMREEARRAGYFAARREAQEAIAAALTELWAREGDGDVTAHGARGRGRGR